MNDKRRFARKRILYYLKINDAVTGENLGHLCDISSEGLMMISSRPVDVGMRHSLQIELPEEIGSKQSIALDAQSVWCKTDANPSLYCVGFHFSGNHEAELFTIIGLIARYTLGDA